MKLFAEEKKEPPQKNFVVVVVVNRFNRFNAHGTRNGLEEDCNKALEVSSSIVVDVL